MEAGFYCPQSCGLMVASDSISPMLYRPRTVVLLATGLLALFALYFLMFVHIIDDNRMHPSQGRAHDANGVPVGPP